MADQQLGALSKMIVEGDLRAFIDGKITTEFFPDDKYRKVYEWLLKHWRQYAAPANEEAVARAYPTYKWVHNDPQPTQYYIDQLRRSRKEAILLMALQEAAAVMADDEEPEQAEKVEFSLSQALIKLRTETSTTRDIDLTTAWSDMLVRIGARRDNPGSLRGLPTGFPGIDFVTGGLQPEQFIVITGVPKSGKSSFLLYMALAIFLFGERPMFLGFEMSNEEQYDRLTSLVSGMGLTDILNGTLSTTEWGHVHRKMKRTFGASGLPNFIFSADVTSGMTVSGLQAKINDFQPSVLFIDGAYMLDSELDPRQYAKGSPQALTDISRSLKRLAQTSRIPVVITTQSLVARSKGGLTIGSLGYTSAWGQDADLILGVERVPDTDYSKFHVMESRSGPRKDVYVEWDWSRGHVAELNMTGMTPITSSSGTPKKKGLQNGKP